MLKVFVKYALVGGVNTGIHWATFVVVYYIFTSNQMVSNFVGFSVAVTFSFFVNAKWTFQAEKTAIRYLLYVGFMGILALGCGYLADYIHLNPFVTLIGFSVISLVVGFLYSTYIVFKEEK